MKAAGNFLALLLLLSCQRIAPKATVAALRFPVALLFENSAPLVCREAGELRELHTNYLTLNNEPPRLIDSGFRIYRLEKFKSVHGGMWLMAHPSGTTEVTFELAAAGEGSEQARALFASQLEKQTWRDDLAARRAALAKSDSLLQMVELVQRPEN